MRTTKLSTPGFRIAWFIPIEMFLGTFMLYISLHSNAFFGFLFFLVVLFPLAYYAKCEGLDPDLEAFAKSIDIKTASQSIPVEPENTDTKNQRPGSILVAPAPMQT